MKNQFSLILKGAAMGVAEAIPGVSGGTIAFITGIYERLINSIKSFGPTAVNAWKRDGINGFWKAIDGTFLLFLLGGMFVGIVAGIFGITWILEHYPVLLWAFFFGLIVGSAVYIGKQVSAWSPTAILGLLGGVALAYYITIATPSTGSDAWWYIFLSGMIAISALILPGISGSFILLLMGMYTVIIPTVKEVLKTFDPAAIKVVAIFAVGCLVGLVSFSRILSWTFKHYRNTTMAVLTGFMIGSLNKIWPWRKVIRGLDEDGQLIMWTPESKIDKVLEETNLLPGQYALEIGAAYLPYAIALMVVGFLSVFLLEKIGERTS